MCAHGTCSHFRLHPSASLQERKLACTSSRQKSPFHFALAPRSAGIGLAQTGTHPWAAVSHPSCLPCQAWAQGFVGFRVVFAGFAGKAPAFECQVPSLLDLMPGYDYALTSSPQNPQAALLIAAVNCN